MADTTTRVARWRQRLRDEGRAALTIWLPKEEKLRLEDLALTCRTSPSALVQQALAQFRPTQPSRALSDTDMSQLRLLIHEVLREEVPGMVREVMAETTTVADTSADTVTETLSAEAVTDAVTETVAATLAHDLPAMVRQIVEEMALGAIGLPVTATRSDVAVTEAPRAMLAAEDLEASPVKRKPGRPGILRQPILDLLRAHPEGLTATQMKVYLGTDKNIGDTLSGMVRNGLLVKQGSGKALRYTVR